MFLHAYDDELRSRNPSSPALDPALAAALRADGSWASRVVRDHERPEQELLVRLPWRQGACTHVLVTRPAPREPGALGLPPPGMWLLPGLAVGAALLLSLSPLVRRIRRLTTEVRASARAGYAGPISHPSGGGDEIDELARAFAGASREVREKLELVERRERTLREFVENTNHDVMIPLTTLQGHLASLRDAAESGRAEPAAIAAAMDDAHYLASLVHNLAVAAKLEAGEPELAFGRVDLTGVVARAVARQKVIARQRQVELESAVPEAPLACEGDVTLIEQAVSNVIHNAIRHNRAGGHVAVLLEAVAGDRFRLRVIDDGPGLPDEVLARLGERRYRTDEARAREPDGKGLGLSIANEVAARHGFTLRFGRSEYGGLEVTLEGPSATAAAPRPPPPA